MRLVRLPDRMPVSVPRGERPKDDEGDLVDSLSPHSRAAFPPAQTRTRRASVTGTLDRRFPGLDPAGRRAGRMAARCWWRPAARGSVGRRWPRTRSRGTRGAARTGAGKTGTRWGCWRRGEPTLARVRQPPGVLGIGGAPVADRGIRKTEGLTDRRQSKGPRRRAFVGAHKRMRDRRERKRPGPRRTGRWLPEQVPPTRPHPAAGEVPGHSRLRAQALVRKDGTAPARAEGTGGRDDGAGFRSRGPRTASCRHRAVLTLASSSP
jgi:hypothetical protein